MSLLKKIIIITSCIVVVTGIAYATTSIANKSQKKENSNPSKNTVQQKTSLPIEIASDSGLDQTADASSTWPGEIISSTALEVHPSSEGVISSLDVRVGQMVRAGQIVGKLSAPPASMERAERAGERIQMLTKARANVKTTTRLVLETKKQLMKELESLRSVQNTSTSFIEKDAEKDQFTNSNTPVEYEKMKQQKEKEILLIKAERDQTQIELLAKESKLRVSMQHMLEKDLPMITDNYIDRRTDWKTLVPRFKMSVGTLGRSRIEYERAFRKLIDDLENQSSVTLSESSLSYVQSFKDLAFATETSDDMSGSDISNVRKMAQANKLMVLEMVNEYKEKKNMVIVKEAEVSKMVAETEKELTLGLLGVTTSKINSEKIEGSRKKMIAETQKEFIEKQREIESKIIELDRELDNAQAEVRATEIGYKTFTSELGAQTIISPKNGIITGIFKTVGEYVMPSDSIALISDGKETKIFVRFRMPSDEAVLQRGDEVFVIRPGFPFDKKQAVISGSGTTLDESGSYTVEAEFLKSPPWPLHALVRVMPLIPTERIIIPFTALWWDEEKNSHVYVVVQGETLVDRIVKTGRAIGDRVEIMSGLSLGEKYLSKIPSSELIEQLMMKDQNKPQKDFAPQSMDSAEEKNLLEELDELDKQDDEGGDGHGH